MAYSKKGSNPVVFSDPKKEINYFVVFGDSLSDGKNMGEKASFLGPFARKLWLKITGLDRSPKERFTNGYTWADSLKSTLISKFLNDDQLKKNRFGKYNLDNADISDDILFRSHNQRKKYKYTQEEVQDEINEVKRKQRVEDREEGHLFTAEQENTQKTAPISRRYPKNAPSTAPINKKELPKATLRESSDDVSDQFISDPRYHEYVQEYYSLDNGRVAQYNGQNFYRNYSQGGSTSYDYSWKGIFLSILSPLTSIKLFITRFMVSNVSQQIKQFLKDNKDEGTSKDHKKKTLITVFSGANDLITVNSEPTEEAAELAAQSNIDNIESLIKQGYSNFVLCNLPDLSLTPRYQHKSDDERKNAQKISNLFNDKLAEKLQTLKERYPGRSIDLFDIKSVFTKVYEDVRDNGNLGYGKYFDKSSLTEPYLDYAKAHNIPIVPGGVAPGNKHMFWDDVHPTATMHALLMSEFYKSKEGLGKYKISAPEEQSTKRLSEIFNRKYHEKLEELSFGFFSFCTELRIPYEKPEKALITILHYAFTDQSVDGDCVRETMTDLGWWIDDKPNMRIPALADAMWILDPDYARKLEAELDPHLAKPDSYKMMMYGTLRGQSAEPKPLPKKVPPSELLALDPAVKERLQKMMDNKSSIKEPETPLQPIKTSDLKQEVSVTTPLTI